MSKELLEKDERIRKAYGLSMFVLKALNNALATHIGNTDGDLTTIGFEKRAFESDAHILCTGRLPIEHTKFNGANVGQILKSNAVKLGLSENTLNKVLDKLNAFENNKLIVVPFKEKTAIKCFYEKTEGMKQKIDGEVYGVQYGINKETLKAQYKLIVRGVEVYTPILWVNIDEFNNTFYDSEFDNINKSGIDGKPLIEFNRYGCVKPLKLRGNKCNYIVDNCWVYAEQGDKLTILGKLNKGLIEPEENIDIKQYASDTAYKNLIKSSFYIEKYKNFIVPYGLSELNVI